MLRLDPVHPDAVNNPAKLYFDPANPFRYRQMVRGELRTFTIAVQERRLERLRDLTAAELRAVLKLPMLQENVRQRAATRLRVLEREEAAA